MTGSEPLLPGLTLSDENVKLFGLYEECEVFLQKWEAYRPYSSEAVPDAIVAILTLQQEVVARRAFILGWLTQEELPF